MAYHRRYQRGDELTALAIEARRRGITYGKLVAETTPLEREKIIEKYREEAEKERGKQG